MPYPKSALGLAAAAGAATLWAISGVFGKILMTGWVSPSQLVFYRSAFGSALLAAILLLKNKALLKVSLHDLPFLIALGVLGLALTQFFYYAAIRSMSVGLAILLEYLAPLWIILFERLWRKKPIARAKILALALALSGCFLVSLPAGSGAQLSSKGLFFGIAAGICFASYSLMSQQALKSYPETAVLFYSLFFTALFWGVLASGIKASWLTMSHFQFGLILYVTTLGTVVPFFLFVFALKCLEASQVGIISTLEPVLAAVIAWIHLGERLTLMQIVGGFLVLSAIVLLQTLQPKLASEITEAAPRLR
jgi:drug/metabolite transporter (DMT)-like permease